MKTALCLGLLFLVGMAAGCNREAGLPSADSARGNTLSVLLGEPATESGNGLHFLDTPDGPTSLATLDGVPCRRLALQGRGSGYLYFSLDPAFKQGELKNVRVAVEYFDDQPGLLRLQFDGSKTWQIPDAAYASADHIAGLSGSKEWKTAVFHLRDPTFNNAQKAQADFRLCVHSPELHVRRVVVTRGVEDRPQAQPFLPGGDFSATNTVSISLGEAEQEGAGGLFHNPAERDGRTAITNLDGTPCRYSTLANKPWAYFYFAIEPSFKNGELRDADLEVEYFAPRRVAINIEFDASKSRNIAAPAFAKAGPDLWVPGTPGWQTNVFHLRNATFENAQNGGADFRLTIRPPVLFVRRVTLTRGTGKAPLTP
jgi:hypothetical protein